MTSGWVFGTAAAVAALAHAQSSAPPEHSDADIRARDKASLERLQPARDTDGDPRTIEGIAPDGARAVILIQTSDPELFRGMTPAEFARAAYP